MRIDQWPSTPIKQITAWVMSVAWFLFSLAIIWWNRVINEAVYYALTGATLGIDVSAVAQFNIKRKTSWVPAQTTSEMQQPAAAGQPVKPPTAGSE